MPPGAATRTAWSALRVGQARAERIVPIVKESARFRKNKILFRVTKTLPANDYLGTSLTKHKSHLSYFWP